MVRRAKGDSVPPLSWSMRQAQVSVAGMYSKVVWKSPDSLSGKTKANWLPLRGAVARADGVVLP